MGFGFWVLGYGVWGLGFEGRGLGFGGWNSGVRVKGVTQATSRQGSRGSGALRQGLRLVWGLVFRVWVSCFVFRVSYSVFRVFELKVEG